MIAVILSGGAGTRLWPVSRELYPKPFMKLPDGQSLLQKAFLRAANLGVEKVLTVTGQEYYFSTLNEYKSVNSADLELSFVIEPLRRNTAPAIAMAAFWVQEQAPDQVMLVLSSDQIIQNQAAFETAVTQAEIAAQQGYLVTFGIHPSYPATGFGYIQQGEAVGEGAYQVKRFVEKPSFEKAEAYLAEGQYHWNAGIFCFKASTYLEALHKSRPDIYEAALRCWQARPVGEPSFLEAALFKQIPAESVDFAVMEKADKVAVVPGDFGWSDLGSWDAAAALVPADEHGNRVFGDAVLLETENTFVQTQDRVVAVIGVKDLVIVDTPDALLVAHRERVQDVKKVVEKLTESHHDLVRKHRTIQRPWGNYTVLEETPTFGIRRMVIRPGQALTNHLHHQRSEHWTVLSGTAHIWLDNNLCIVQANQTSSALAGTAHQICNSSLSDLVMIEIQTGEYLGEDDVERLGSNFAL